MGLWNCHQVADLVDRQLLVTSIELLKNEKSTTILKTELNVSYLKPFWLGGPLDSKLVFTDQWNATMDHIRIGCSNFTFQTPLHPLHGPLCTLSRDPYYYFLLVDH